MLEEIKSFFSVVRQDAHREKHVLLVLVDSPGVGDSLIVLDHTDGLTCARGGESQNE